MTYTTFDDPSGSTGITEAFGVNDADQIVGDYQDGTGNHGYLLSGGTFTTLDAPSAINGTVARGINGAGQIVGDYQDINLDDHGFLLSGDVYTTLDDPSASGTTVPTGINAKDQIVGFYFNAGTGYHGFLFDPTAGKFPPYFTLEYPSASQTFASGINDAGQIVGFYDNATGRHGFLLSGGIYSTLDDPLANNPTHLLDTVKLLMACTPNGI